MFLTTAYLMWKSWRSPGSLNQIPATLLALGLAGGAVASPLEPEPGRRPLTLRETISGLVGVVSVALRLSLHASKVSAIPVSS